MAPLPKDEIVKEVEKVVRDTIKSVFAEEYNKYKEQMKQDIKVIISDAQAEAMQKSQALQRAEEIMTWSQTMYNITATVCTAIGVALASIITLVAYRHFMTASKDNPAKLSESARKKEIASLEPALKGKAAVVPDIETAIQKRLGHKERAENMEELKYEYQHGSPSSSAKARAKSSSPEAEASGAATSSGFHPVEKFEQAVGLKKRQGTSSESSDESNTSAGIVGSVEGVIPGTKAHKAKKEKSKGQSEPSD